MYRSFNTTAMFHQQATYTKDKIALAIETSRKYEAKGDFIKAKDFMLRAREMVNGVAGQKNWQRSINSDLKRLDKITRERG